MLRRVCSQVDSMTGLGLSDVPDPSEESGTRSVIERIRPEHIARHVDAPVSSDYPFPVVYRFLCPLGIPRGTIPDDRLWVLRWYRSQEEFQANFSAKSVVVSNKGNN